MKTTLLLSLCLLLGPLAHAAGLDQSHGKLDALLKSNVTDGWVDYGALKNKPAPLVEYLDALAVVKETEFNGWPEKERFAFLINLYNATTLKLIVDHHPVGSIKDIGGVFKGPWKQEVVRLFGKVTTLDNLEHGIIRKQYHDPRAHFALVCAAKGCPPLRSEAYVASRLDEQLDDQARVFLGQTAKNRVDANAHSLYLSPIFKWFSGDFEAKSGSVLKFLTPYFPEKDRNALAAGGFKIRYTDYDWSLNNKSSRP
ncbi:MAG: DUF547 domain-containing protein [Verrucomicrobiota bacterium]